MKNTIRGTVKEAPKIPLFSFFKRSDSFDHMTLRLLSYICPNWELIWDYEQERYSEEEDSYANVVNTLINELEHCKPPMRYHDNEDRLAEYVIKHLKWNIHKFKNCWIGMDYESILQQGGAHDINEGNLILAAAGRIRAAIDRGQLHFDNMEESHQRMLAAVISIILYYRTDAAL